MKIPNNMQRLKGFSYPREIIAYAVWAYHRFALSTADVEDLLVERGVIVSRQISGFGSIASVDILQIALGGIGRGRTTSGT
jgi:putative transposase